MAKVRQLNSPSYIIGITLLVCLVAAVIVGGAVALLTPRQQLNERVYLEKSLLTISGISYNGLSNQQIATLVDQRLVPVAIDMTTGLISQQVNPKTYNAKNALKSLKTSIILPAGKDIANIRRIPKYQIAYFIKNDTNKVTAVLLPVNGSGLWSMLWGYVAVQLDGNTIQAIGFYKQGETPGLGARITDPTWDSTWSGKKIYGSDGTVDIAVVKNGNNQNSFVVDGLSGATLTSKGVSHLIKFWMGSMGYQRFLTALKEGKIQTNV